MQSMKQSDIAEILKEATKDRNIDYMSIGELKGMIMALTGIIVGLLLTSNKSVEEIKEVIKQ